eukprot:Hpha_TRINITY_DN11134_c0_g1::TRINITY_DN11134_c0_g1_i1::g.27970::m.27970
MRNLYRQQGHAGAAVEFHLEKWLSFGGKQILLQQCPSCPPFHTVFESAFLKAYGMEEEGELCSAGGRFLVSFVAYSYSNSIFCEERLPSSSTLFQDAGFNSH